MNWEHVEGRGDHCWGSSFQVEGTAQTKTWGHETPGCGLLLSVQEEMRRLVKLEGSEPVWERPSAPQGGGKTHSGGSREPLQVVEWGILREGVAGECANSREILWGRRRKELGLSRPECSPLLCLFLAV